MDLQIFFSSWAFYPRIATGWHLGGELVRRSVFGSAYNVDTNSDLLSSPCTTGIWHSYTVYLDDEWTHALTFTRTIPMMHT